MPYYNSLEGADKLDIFKDTYEDVVKNQPFTIFVCSKMTKDALLKDIMTRRSYGIKTLNIHGIGTSNIKIIREIVKDLEEKRESLPNRIDTKSEKASISIKIVFLQ